MSRELVRRTEGGISFLEAGSGVPVLMLHGIPGSALTWAGVGSLLSDRYRVIIPDLMGFGSSDAPAGDYYMDAQADAIQRLMSALSIDSVVLAAHDFGAPVVLTMLRRFPALDVRALVIAATNVFTDTYVPPPLRLARVPILGTAFFMLAAGNAVGLRLMYRAGNRQGLTAPQEHLTAGGIDLTRRIFQRSLADLKTNYGAIQDMLGGIGIPTLVLWGDRDPFFATDVGERTARAIPGAQLRVFRDTGHFVPEERPSDVAEEMHAFVSGLPD